MEYGFTAKDEGCWGVQDQGRSAVGIDRCPLDAVQESGAEASIS